MSSFRYTPGPLGDELHAWMPSPILRTRNVLVIFSNSMTVHIVIRDRARPVSQGRNQKSRTGLCFGERGTCSGSRRITSSPLASQPVFLFDLWPSSTTWRRRANHDGASADDGHARTARARKAKKKKKKVQRHESTATCCFEQVAAFGVWVLNSGEVLAAGDAASSLI
jgi:hypothetical protein